MAAVDSYDTASQVLAFALDCLQARGRCDGLRAFISPGIAAYDCDQLTARVFKTRVDSKNQCDTFYSVGVELQLVRCCVPMGSADGPADPAAIDAAAKCIYDDLFSIFECISCEATLSDGLRTITCNGLELDGIDYDTAPSGMCYGGRIRLFVHKMVCC